jgi:Pyridine nucleotide-disulphide oxidoreductase
VVLALGQEADLSLLDGVEGLEIEDGVVKVDANMMTGHPGIFAGGDMVPAERSVTVGVGHGKQAARRIDGWLRGGSPSMVSSHEPATFDLLNTWYYADAPKTVAARLDVVRRQSSFLIPPCTLSSNAQRQRGKSPFIRRPPIRSV